MKTWLNISIRQTNAMWNQDAVPGEKIFTTKNRTEVSGYVVCYRNHSVTPTFHFHAITHIHIFIAEKTCHIDEIFWLYLLRSDWKLTNAINPNLLQWRGYGMGLSVQKWNYYWRCLTWISTTCIRTAKLVRCVHLQVT